jgi:glutamate racemase
VEEGTIEGPAVDASLRRYLRALLDTGVDVIVLGCTHYPFLRERIQRMCGPGVTLVDPSDAVARQLGRVLAAAELESDAAQGSIRYFTSGEPEATREALARLLGTVDGPVDPADI